MLHVPTPPHVLDMNEQLAAEMAAAFILKTNQSLGQLKLIKLMYLAEREAIRRFLLPIVHDDLFALANGMAMSNAAQLVSKGADRDSHWSRLLVPKQGKTLGVRKHVSLHLLTSLTNDDRHVIQDVVDLHGNRDQDQLVYDVHHKLPEWLAHWHNPERQSQAIPVPLSDLYQSLHPDLTEAQALYLANEYRTAHDRWIESDPNVLGGTPVIADTRVTVYAIHGRLAAGEQIDQLSADYPYIDPGAFMAADMFARAHPLEPHPLGRPWRTAPRSQS